MLLAFPVCPLRSTELNFNLQPGTVDDDVVSQIQLLLPVLQIGGGDLWRG